MDSADVTKKLRAAKQAQDASSPSIVTLAKKNINTAQLISFLGRIASGHLRIIHGEPVTVKHRMDAARFLLNKVMPDMKAIAVDMKSADGITLIFEKNEGSEIDGGHPLGLRIAGGVPGGPQKV